MSRRIGSWAASQRGWPVGGRDGGTRWRAQPVCGHADRVAAALSQAAGAPAHRAAAPGDQGQDRAGGRRGPGQRGDRPQAWDRAQHRGQVAQAVLPGRRGRPGRPQAVRPPAGVPTSGGRLRQGGRLRAAPNPRGPTVTLESCRAARRAAGQRPGQPDLDHDAVVLDLYQRSFAGAPLSEGEYVISADEKTSIQARCRCHPTLPPSRARMMRVEHEYERGGALAYLAAWDVHRARLFGRLEPTTGIEPFDRLVAQVMTVEPYASAERVFWVVDHGSSHRGQASIQRLEGRYHNLRLVHLPVHASWLNQMEIYFSIVQRKVLTPNDFGDLGEVQRRLLGFQRRYEQTAVPFDWRFTKADLDALLRRLDEKEQPPTAA